MKYIQTIKNYYTRVMSLVSEMKAYEKDLSNNKVVERILISFLAKFDPNVSTIEDTYRKSVLFGLYKKSCFCMIKLLNRCGIIIYII